ncbi:hypothetical protein StoSoilB20_19070 [Arthrobacter sp. StoSoilB20]|nr:hypothetical protein StoSoilB20_19070 [Arthrobacter sp. StoSoilB20]
MARGRPLIRSLGESTVQKKLRFLPPLGAECVRDWTTLTTGENVCILPEYGHEVSGSVDTVTEDGAVLWLHLAAGEGRKLFIRAEGLVAWRSPVSRD